MNVAVIGGSVAGLSTALALLKEWKINVVVFERKENIGDDVVCGGAISSFMAEEAEAEIPKHVILHEIKGVKIFSPKNCWSIRSKGGCYGFILDRRGFEVHLAEKVRELGGRFMLKHAVSHPFTLREGYSYVVCADGLLGASSSLLEPLDRSDMHLCVQCEIGWSGDDVELYFGKSVAPGGYAWIFPTGDGMARAGLGVPLSFPGNARSLLEKFLKRDVGRVQAKVIPTSRPSSVLNVGNVLFVGDAARLCDPLTGGGIANAIISGKACARAVLENSPERYAKYVKSVVRRNRFRYALKQAVYDMTDEEFDEMLEGLNHYRPSEIRSLSSALFRGVIALALHKPKIARKFISRVAGEIL